DGRGGGGHHECAKPSAAMAADHVHANLAEAVGVEDTSDRYRLSALVQERHAVAVAERPGSTVGLANAVLEAPVRLLGVHPGGVYLAKREALRQRNAWRLAPEREGDPRNRPRDLPTAVG